MSKKIVVNIDTLNVHLGGGSAASPALLPVLLAGLGSAIDKRIAELTQTDDEPAVNTPAASQTNITATEAANKARSGVGQNPEPAPEHATEPVAESPAVTRANVLEFLGSDSRYTCRTLTAIEKHFPAGDVRRCLEDLEDGDNVEKLHRRRDGAVMYRAL